MSSVTQTGVYYGYARVSREKDGEVVLSEDEAKVHPMVMSLGWNPFYKNEKMTAVSKGRVLTHRLPLTVPPELIGSTYNA